MAKSENSYINAYEYALCLNKYLRDNVIQYLATLWTTPTGSGSSWSINNTYSTKQTIIDAYAVPASAWNFTKSASNPLVAKAYNGGANHEYYPTCPVKVGSDYRCIAKNNNEGWGYSGLDGISWSEDGKYLEKGTSGQWDDVKASPGCMKYINDTFNLCYNGYTTDQIHKVGYASTNSWGVFTKNPAIQYGVDEYNSANGTSYVHAIISDVLLIGTTYYYFGIVANADYTRAVFCMGVGSADGNFYDYKLTIPILDTAVYGFAWGQFPNAFKHPTTGEWILTVTLGRLIQDSSQMNQAIYNIYSGRTDIPDFSEGTLNPQPILKPTVANAWENNYNYCPVWWKNNDGTLIDVIGEYWLYFSGHEDGATFDYTGAMCLAKITTIP